MEYHGRWQWRQMLYTTFPEYQLESMPGPKLTEILSARALRTSWMLSGHRRNQTGLLPGWCL
jgi:hypothetical protein